jgi:kynurenine formamidase
MSEAKPIVHRGPDPRGPDQAEHEHGMLALIDDAKRAATLTEVREGRMYDLGHVLDEHIPVFPGRYFKQTLVTTAHHANPRGGVGENDVNWITELVAATMQLGTHLDALSHLQMGDRGYGGITVSELAGIAGVTRLGVHTVPQIVTRGWLVDVPGLGPGGVIRPEDCSAIDPEPGDAVLFHTGWGGLWDDPDTYLGGEPGPGCELAQWLADRRVALTGCDTWSCGPVPPEDPDRPFRVPQILNIDHGIFVVENLYLDELAADGIGRFVLILTHPKLRGATGAWTSPIALV